MQCAELYFFFCVDEPHETPLNYHAILAIGPFGQVRTSTLRISSITRSPRPSGIGMSHCTVRAKVSNESSYEMRGKD